MGSVTVQQLDGSEVEIKKWLMYRIPLNPLPQLDDLIKESEGKTISIDDRGYLFDGPNLFYGTFNIDEPKDTYLDTTGWGKVNLRRFGSSYCRKTLSVKLFFLIFRVSHS